jgi:DNA-binding XRE family transcriptional regulator
VITRTSALTALDVERNVQQLFLGVAQGRRAATAPETVDRFFVARDIRTFRDTFVLEIVAPRELIATAVLQGVNEWTTPVAPAPELSDSEDEANLAILRRALASPHVQAAAYELPEPTGNLVRDVRATTSLTNHDLAELFGVKERTIFNIQSGRSRASYEPTLRSLLAIGSILVPGLGPAGVKRWLTLGHPSRLDRIRNGEIEQVHEEARAYLR